METFPVRRRRISPALAADPLHPLRVGFRLLWTRRGRRARRAILFTLLALFVLRFGFWVNVPGARYAWFEPEHFGFSNFLPPILVNTERLLLRKVGDEDADFLVQLTNDPDFLRFVGDRSIRTRDDAIAYLRTGPFLRHAGELGFCVVTGRSSGRPLGVCGLLQREGLADVDLGFAFLPEHRGHGYAFEAADAMLQYGQRRLQLPRVVAIVDPANERSIALLGKLGMRFERALCLAPDDKLLHLYAIVM